MRSTSNLATSSCSSGSSGSWQRHASGGYDLCDRGVGRVEKIVGHPPSCDVISFRQPCVREALPDSNAVEGLPGNAAAAILEAE